MAQPVRVNIKVIEEEPAISAGNIRNEFFREYCQLAGDLTQHIGSNSFTNSLCAMFAQLLVVDDVSICLLRSDQLPKEMVLSSTDKKGEQARIREGLFLDSYPSNHSPPLLAVHEASQSIRYFHSFKPVENSSAASNHGRFLDASDPSISSCSYLFKLKSPQVAVIRISLRRSTKSQGFHMDELNCLSEIIPLLSNLITQHFSPIHEASFKSILRHELDSCMENFGLRILSRREHQIVTMILSGYSNKGISESLNISVETVKLHRKNAYAKLNIKSMGEMFSLFLTSMLSQPIRCSAKT